MKSILKFITSNLSDAKKVYDFEREITKITKQKAFYPIFTNLGIYEKCYRLICFLEGIYPETWQEEVYKMLINVFPDKEDEINELRKDKFKKEDTNDSLVPLIEGYKNKYVINYKDKQFELDKKHKHFYLYNLLNHPERAHGITPNEMEGKKPNKFYYYDDTVKIQDINKLKSRIKDLKEDKKFLNEEDDKESIKKIEEEINFIESYIKKEIYKGKPKKFTSPLRRQIDKINKAIKNRIIDDEKYDKELRQFLDENYLYDNGKFYFNKRLKKLIGK